jgi:DNA/RNA-binding protein KIN17
MPKAEKGSLKDLGKKIKAKGLQKLRFYCQMCEKQCRDANGFKCHLTSDSHLRQMKIFSENSGRILNANSREFETHYLDALRMRHGTAKVNANQVYQQVISDKSHIHMNGTIWSTLSGFVQYLGKTGKCIVEETERGWYITYINRDAGKLQREEIQKQRQKSELEAEMLTQQRMEKQRIAAAEALDRATAGTTTEDDERTAPTVATDGTAAGSKRVELHLGNGGILNNPKKRKIVVRGNNKSIFGDDEDEDDESKVDGDDEKVAPAVYSSPALPPMRTATTTTTTSPKKKKKSKMEKASDRVPENQNQDETPWLLPKIQVRIVNKKLCDGKYYRQKGTVERLEDDDYTAIVVVGVTTDDHRGDVLKLDQDDLETVVPKKAGERVKLVRGEHRGSAAVVQALNKDKCRAELELLTTTTTTNADNGSHKTGDLLLRKVPYDDFSKLAE